MATPPLDEPWTEFKCNITDTLLEWLRREAHRRSKETGRYVPASVVLRECIRNEMARQGSK